MNNATLVILAAGMGSRFGGLKQLEPVGPNKEFIIDYSIYDAIRAGFNKVVFIIKKENYDVFRETIGKRIEKKVKVEYAFQEMEEAREKYNIPEDRVKPLGTTHAILCVKNLVNEPFLVINSDDFYGRDAFIDAVNFLKTTNYEENGIVLYKIANTLTENGKVKRGVCTIENNKLIDAIESSVSLVDDNVVAEPLNGDPSFNIEKDHEVSMNMFILLPQIFAMLEELFNEFMLNNQDNLDKCEALILEDLFKLIKKNKISLNVVKTNAKWFGVTYKEDKEDVVGNINNLIQEGIYPNNLWRDKQ